jgi:molybdopterin-guanine dinucleotide biosynthesis protein A
MHDCSSGQDKGLLTVDGKTFVERLLLCFAPKVSAVLISANRYFDATKQLPRRGTRKFCPIQMQDFTGHWRGF